MANLQSLLEAENRGQQFTDWLSSYNSSQEKHQKLMVDASSSTQSNLEAIRDSLQTQLSEIQTVRKTREEKN